MSHDWRGLRVSHFRVVSLVPDVGINVTDLALRVGMTKQGCGQFVTQLVESGHLTSEPDPDDGRVRWVRRTARGSETMADVARVVGGLEERWSAAVGAERYRAFRDVLEELAGGDDIRSRP